MPSRHALRIGSRLKILISTVLQRDLRDPRLGFITILAVEPTEDMKEAKVLFSVLGSPGDRSKALHALNDARGFIQKKIGRSLRIRHTPALRFVLDEGEDRLGRVEELLEQARREAERSSEGEAPKEEPPTEAEE